MNKQFGKFARKLAGVAMASVMVCATGAALAGCSLLPNNPADQKPNVTQSKYMRDIYEDYFSIGAAVLTSNVGRYDEAGLMKHFNSITGENEMKWRFVEPAEGEFSFAAADQLVTWAQNNDTKVRGHCLLWYKSLPAWLAQKEMNKEEALAVIDRHVTETVKHFGDSIYAWDVCNEVLRNTVTDAQLASGDIWRTGAEVTWGQDANSIVDWYALTGTDFLKQAFRSADNARKELGIDVKLYYNDYSLNTPNKRQAVVELVKVLREEGIPIDGIGMQAHYRLPGYTADKAAFMREFEESIKTFTELGLDVQITELDLCVYGSNDEPQAFDALPWSVEVAQAEMFADIFSVCRKYSKPQTSGSGTVTNVTTWGVADDHTWGTNSVHREYPLIFARDYSEKRAYYEIITF